MTRLFVAPVCLLVARGLALSACRPIVAPPSLPHEIAPVLMPHGADRSNGIDE